MRALLLLPGLLLAMLFALLAVSSALTGNWGGLSLFAVLTWLCLPASGRALGRLAGGAQLQLRLALIAALLAFGAWRFVSGTPGPIYASPEIRARFHAIYDDKMQNWPLPYDDIMLSTRYGRVHVIASGPQDAPPLLLLHASGVGSWSWKWNAAALGSRYRLFAVDLIGDVGKSDYADPAHVMKTGRDQADLYAEIADLLGIARAPVIGASEGGFVASNFALYHPDRVEKLVLLGPMGYSGATSAIAVITLAQLFPLPSVQRFTFRWAFSGDAKLQADYTEWFPLLMRETHPAKVAPLPLSAAQRRAITAPTLFVFGTRDNLVGDPARAAERVSDMPDARVEVVDAGHLMAAEAPELVTPLILDFLAD
ncbi:alpha/beta fold hydrolase [Marimonas lutisalis]|uniref:alpha/beta fold hydrolase n=1 Tax=Marimonas lutisalis TaxID=2545756 RepID=UPI0010F80B75|nr:alpha/beta hydrolase [Marimonas lutisalis]